MLFVIATEGTETQSCQSRPVIFQCFSPDSYRDLWRLFANHSMAPILSREKIPKFERMNYRQLGKSGLRISEIGFGCMSLEKNNPKNQLILQKAVDYGINFFDTADLYDHGENEIIVGRALKDRRKDIFIASKAGNQWRADGSGWDWNPRKAYILGCAEQSLRRLQTDYIDLYQLHGGTIEDPIDETIEAFELLRRQGKIRHYGISSIRPNVIREYCRRSDIVSVMMQYSLLDRRPEETCLGLLERRKVGVLARGSLAKGLLAGKPPADYLNYSAEHVGNCAAAAAALSGPERSHTATALQFVLAQPAISSAVVGIRTEEQLMDAVGATDAPALTRDEIAMLRRELPVNRYELHR